MSGIFIDSNDKIFATVLALISGGDTGAKPENPTKADPEKPGQEESPCGDTTPPEKQGDGDEYDMLSRDELKEMLKTRNIMRRVSGKYSDDDLRQMLRDKEDEEEDEEEDEVEIDTNTETKEEIDTENKEEEEEDEGEEGEEDEEEEEGEEEEEVEIDTNTETKEEVEEEEEEEGEEEEEVEIEVGMQVKANIKGKTVTAKVKSIDYDAAKVKVAHGGKIYNVPVEALSLD